MSQSSKQNVWIAVSTSRSHLKRWLSCISSTVPCHCNVEPFAANVKKWLSCISSTVPVIESLTFSQLMWKSDCPVSPALSHVIESWTFLQLNLVQFSIVLKQYCLKGLESPFKNRVKVRDQTHHTYPPYKHLSNHLVSGQSSWGHHWLAAHAWVHWPGDPAGLQAAGAANPGQQPSHPCPGPQRGHLPRLHRWGRRPRDGFAHWSVGTGCNICVWLGLWLVKSDQVKILWSPSFSSSANDESLDHVKTWKHYGLALAVM